MIFIVASLCLQIVCAVHVIRSGRNQIWLLFIFLFSLLGCFAYLVLEVLPQHWNNRHLRTARAQVAVKVDPERAVRDAERSLDLAETAANYIALGDAQAGRHRYAEAEAAYRKALSLGPGNDWGTQVKLAAVLFERGESAEALRLLDAAPELPRGSEWDRRALLRARILADLGRSAEARALFEDLVERIAGEEARCHYAAFLLQQSDTYRAQAVLEEVERRARRMDRTQRAAQAEMYRWADERLAELRKA
ncbi:tetratricopeptide repeat protein [Sphingobium sp. HBC34]|uniref:Tetratricopeptide repeat protein n=1 Tax=Sphingobium cyanobacteriorum TaxID=3063954 RepID=A0ABT8ZG38_9SPHN|nr:tetratricopeptide repeat protein [Sphingobium sp. HBC34]MDO7833505.1 tetratricopeptide repeat protein [Sphingobium sp. HBC34]